VPKKNQVPKLLVIFDTSALFTKVASDLVNQDVKRIIDENSNHADLKIEWYLPEVVIGERKYQMVKKAKELLPNMQKLEKLIGCNFGIGEEALELHVDNAIKKDIRESKIQIATIDTNDIDLENLIFRSVNREPPFEENEKEKGFRDSVIAHSFLHLHKNSPITPKVCLLVLVANDDRLKEYVSELTTDSKNVRMLSNLGELENLINTLVSEISEDFAAELAEKAGKLFFEKDNNKCFYYKNSIGEKIREQYSNELSDTFLLGRLRRDLTWWISPPIFKNKNKQRIHWTTIVEPEFEIYYYETSDTYQNILSPPSEDLEPISKNKKANLAALTSFTQSTSAGLRRLTALTAPQKKVVSLKAKQKFEIHWSSTLSHAQNLTALKLESITYRGHDIYGD